MSMDLIPRELEMVCPACGVHIALDPAFAGSVCRCSSCGALVNVQAQLPEDADTQRHDDPRHRMTAADIHPTVLAEQRAQAGRSVMAYQRDIPPSQLGRRLGLLALVALIMAGVVGGTTYLIHKQNIMSPPASQVQRTDNTTSQQGGSDLLSHAPVFWGIPLDSPAVVLIDATAASEKWLGDIKLEIVKNHDVLQESNVPVTFVFFNGNQIAMPRFESTQPLDEKRLNAITAGGTLLPSDAISRLGRTQIQRLILVSSQALTVSQVQAIDKVLHADTRLDVIWFGEVPVGLNTIVSQHDGKIMQHTIKP